MFDSLSHSTFIFRKINFSLLINTSIWISTTIHLYRCFFSNSIIVFNYAVDINKICVCYCIVQKNIRYFVSYCHSISKKFYEIDQGFHCCIIYFFHFDRRVTVLMYYVSNFIANYTLTFPYYNDANNQIFDVFILRNYAKKFNYSLFHYITIHS